MTWNDTIYGTIASVTLATVSLIKKRKHTVGVTRKIIVRAAYALASWIIFVLETMDGRQQKYWCFFFLKSDRKQLRPGAGAGTPCQMSPLKRAPSTRPLSLLGKELCKKVCSPLFAWISSNLYSGRAPEKSECLNCFEGKSRSRGTGAQRDTKILEWGFWEDMWWVYFIQVGVKQNNIGTEENCNIKQQQQCLWVHKGEKPSVLIIHAFGLYISKFVTWIISSFLWPAQGLQLQTISFATIWHVYIIFLYSCLLPCTAPVK